jgi:hypothetical protein
MYLDVLTKHFAGFPEIQEQPAYDTEKEEHQGNPHNGVTVGRFAAFGGN